MLDMRLLLLALLLWLALALVFPQMFGIGPTPASLSRALLVWICETPSFCAFAFTSDALSRGDVAKCARTCGARVSDEVKTGHVMTERRRAQR